DSRTLGSARILRAGEGILPSRTFSKQPNATDASAKRFRLQSLTREYLTGRKSIPVPKARRPWTSSIKIIGARQHNLKSIDVELDRKSTRLNSSHSQISYAVFCLKK